MKIMVMQMENQLDGKNVKVRKKRIPWAQREPKNRLDAALIRGVPQLSYCWLAFFCSVGVMLLVYYCFHLIPFGDFTILRMDLYHQYGPLFAELYDRLTELKSFFYSWNTGMGSGFLGNYSNYLASPLSFLVVLFGRERILEAIAALILLKAAISSFTFTYYLKRAHNTQSYATAAFGVLYAFCGYFIAYYWNIMWLDGMMLFPLLIVGIEQMIRRKQYGMYIFALAATMYSNYYMGFMACLFSVVYFLGYYFSHFDFGSMTQELPRARNRFHAMLDRLRYSRLLTSGVRFAFASAAAAGLIAFLLLPVYAILQASSATSGSFPKEFTTYFKIFDFLANHLASVEPTIRSSGEDVLPNVFCGIATVMLVPLYLFTKSISVKEKAAQIGLLAFCFFSFNTNFLNYIWHGFHFPNDLPYRFSFMYSFLLLTLAYKAFSRLHEFSARQLLGAGTAVVFGVILIEKITSKNVNELTVFISIAFAVIYVLVFNVLRQKKSRTTAMTVLLLCCVIAEMAVANTDRYSMDQAKTHYAGDYADFRALKEQLDIREDGNDSYRMELAKLRARMDPAWYNYNGVSTFSSMAYEKLSNLEHQLGMFSNFINSHNYHRQTPVYNMMHALQYIVNNDSSLPDMNSELYTYVYSQGIFHAYENKYHLPIAYGVDSALLDWETEHESNPFKVQQDYFKLATGITDDVFTWVTAENGYHDNVYDIDYGFEDGQFSFSKISSGMSGQISFTLTPDETQNLYVFVRSSSMDDMHATGRGFSCSQEVSREYILDLGLCEAGDKIIINMDVKDTSDSGYFTFYAYGLNMDVLQQGYDILKQSAMQVESFEETRITGTVTAQKDGLLYTSVPSDPGWTVFIDDERVPESEKSAIGGALMAVPITKGPHTVELRFKPKYWNLGLAVSSGTVLLLVLYILFEHRRKKNCKRKPLLVLEETMEQLTQAETEVKAEMQRPPLPPLAAIPTLEKEDIDMEKWFDSREADLPGEVAPDTKVQDEEAP